IPSPLPAGCARPGRRRRRRPAPVRRRNRRGRGEGAPHPSGGAGVPTAGARRYSLCGANKAAAKGIEMTATAPAYPRAAIPASLIEGLSALVGDRLTTSRAICEAHGRDESFHPAVAPDAVVFATSTEEVAAVVRLCAAHKAPIIPFGVGTSLEGHVAALRGGVCIDLSRMNAILEVNEADLDCRVQAGVTR